MFTIGAAVSTKNTEQSPGVNSLPWVNPDIPADNTPQVLAQWLQYLYSGTLLLFDIDLTDLSGGPDYEVAFEVRGHSGGTWYPIDMSGREVQIQDGPNVVVLTLAEYADIVMAFEVRALVTLDNMGGPATRDADFGSIMLKS